MINGYRGRELEILLIMMKTNEIEGVIGGEREIEREREREIPGKRGEEKT